MHHILQLTNLESLTLEMWGLSLWDPFPCGCFELLEALPKLSRLAIHGNACPNTSRTLKNMEVLANIDEVVIDIGRTREKD